MQVCNVQGICLVPKRMVDRLSGAFDELGEQQHSNAALELPPCKQQPCKQTCRFGNTEEFFDRPVHLEVCV